MKLSKWFWGLFFIGAGGAVIANAMGCFESINLLTLIFTILLIPIIIKSIPRLNFAGILFPLAIIGILFSEPLGITEITPWPILAAALFLSIGLTIIFHKRISRCHLGYNEEHFETIVNENDPDIVEYNIQFSSSIKYVNSDNFQKGKFKCSFGAMKIYFDNAKVSDQGAEIYLDVSFAGVELYIPKEWKVTNQMNASLGGVTEKNRSLNGDGPTVILKGNVSLAGVEIIYI